MLSIAAVGEFVASVVLYTHANRPISIEILAQLRSLSFGTAAAYSVLLIALVLAITLGARLAEDGRSICATGALEPPCQRLPVTCRS